MFTQNVMQAFRSVFVALLIGCICPTWSTAQESKVDASVLKAAQTQSTVSVAIYLQDKPPSRQISKEVKARFQPDIRAKSAEIRDRIRSFRRQNRALPPDVKAEVRVMQESLDTQTGQMQQEIGRRLKKYVAASQQRVRTAIEKAGGTVHAEVALDNSMGARLPATAVNQIAALNDVRRIGLDTAPVPALEGSAQIIYASRFWDDGSDGGTHDIAVVDHGVDNHPYLRSGSAFIKRRPLAESNHGTKAAGVVASTHSTHKGIAWGLDKLLDASFHPWSYSDARAAMTWAVTEASDKAEVINYSFGGILSEGDRRGCNWIMDYADPDYHEDHGGFLDDLIDTHDVLVVKSAGNEADPNIYPPKLNYSLSWGSDSYNAIIVGATDAIGANQPRAKNIVTSYSSAGPTPGGRKKPDVVAPGAGITTTSWPGGGFSTFDGTSAAAPHVSGAILLFWDHGLSDPMMQKALLINSAEDRGAPGWDLRWGWGHIDLYAALDQYDYTRRGSIDGGAEKWYSGTMNECQTVTLVWHKHPETPLSNLDMYLYDAGTHGFIGVSNSIRDNVEQIELASGQDRAVYLRIVHRGSETETFGLAAPSEFLPIGNPIP